MILSNKGITMVLTRLRRSAGWSAPLLFANPRKQFFFVVKEPNKISGQKSQNQEHTMHLTTHNESNKNRCVCGGWAGGLNIFCWSNLCIRFCC